MRNYVKPESEVIVLNMSENIAASSNGEYEYSSSTTVFSENGFVSQTQISWSVFEIAMNGTGWSNVNMFDFFYNQMGLTSVELSKCIRTIEK